MHKIFDRVTSLQITSIFHKLEDIAKICKNFCTLSHDYNTCTHTHILNFLFSTIGKSQYVRARGGKIIVSITNFTKEFITSISLYLLFLLLSSQIITLSLIDTHKKCKVFFYQSS